MVSPAKFLASDKLLERYLIVSAMIPIVFIAMKRFDVQPISLEAADQIVGAISLFYPALISQYAHMKGSMGTGAAASLALFYLVLFSVLFASVAHSAVQFFKHRSEIGPAGTFEILTIMFGIPCLIIFVLLDEPEPKLSSFTSLYFDRFGIYYIRQWLLLFTLVEFVGATALICSLQRLVSNRTEKR